VIMDLMNECSKELNQGFIVILDTEEQTIEEGHWVLLNIS